MEGTFATYLETGYPVVEKNACGVTAVRWLTDTTKVSYFIGQE